MPAASYLTHNPGFTTPHEPLDELSAVRDLLDLGGVVRSRSVSPRYAREARFGMYVFAGGKRETDVSKTAALLRENFFWSTDSHRLFQIENACKTTVGGGDARLDGDYVSIPKPWAFPRAVNFPHVRLRYGNSDMVECMVQATLHEAVLVFNETPLEEVAVRRWERKVVGRNLGKKLESAVRGAVEQDINPKYPVGQKWVYETASS